MSCLFILKFIIKEVVYVGAKRTINKRIRKSILKISGKTNEGYFVLQGVGKFIDCIGLPLIFILDEMKKNKCVVDWCDFIDYSIEKKWDIHQTLSKIEEALIDNKVEKEEILMRIKIYLKKKFNLSCF